MRKSKDISGIIFGELIAIKKTEQKYSHTYWECKCSCGKEIIVRYSKLISGKKINCGHHKFYLTDFMDSDKLCLNCNNNLTIKQERLGRKFCGIKCANLILNRSTEHRLSSANIWKGKKRPPFSEECIINMSIAQKKKWEINPYPIERNKKISLALTGIVRDDQSRAKMSISAAKRISKGNNIKTLTVPHKKTIEKLESIGYINGIDFIVEALIENKSVDILFPKEKIIIEVQGCYWHGCNKCNKTLSKHQIKRIESDIIRTKYLESNGYTVYLLWEHDIKNNIFELNDLYK